MEQEQEKRREFYAGLSVEEQKAEFINGEIESFAVKGFKIPIQAIFDKAVNLSVLAKLLA